MSPDVIVVGGGPGGSTVAWRLAGAGAQVLLLDAAVFPRVKVCAGWVTPAALADAEIDPDKYPLTIQPFTACRLAFAGARHETRWARPASYGILRREFDHHLLERAAAAGADVRQGLRVTAVSFTRDAVHVATERGDFTAPVVVGAGGHRCPVAGALGEISAREQVVVAQESETRLAPRD
ncbi:MAG TPA: FAD-dependent monooxygenase, partial [Methylomirabilota bacterium]|nr:FAD-dependent monooxygenase [Methylomirabilota bacterium]